MCAYSCPFFLAHVGVLALTSQTPDGMGTIRPGRSRCPSSSAIHAVCRAWQAFTTFLAFGILKANHRVSSTSPGMVFRYPTGCFVSASPLDIRFSVPPVPVYAGQIQGRTWFCSYWRIHVLTFMLHGAACCDFAGHQQSRPLAASCNSKHAWLRLKYLFFLIGEFR